MKMIENRIQINYLPKVEIKDYNLTIDGKSFFDQPINSKFKTYEIIRRIVTDGGDDYKVIAVDSSKQQVLDGDPTAIKQINFTTNLDRAENTTMFFIIEESKESVLDFSQGTAKVL